MMLSHKQSTVLKRLLRGAAAAALAYAGAKVPGLLGAFNISGQEQVVVVGVAGPVIVAAEKWLRYGSEPGEGDATDSTDN